MEKILEHAIANPVEWISIAIAVVSVGSAIYYKRKSDRRQETETGFVLDVGLSYGFTTHGPNISDPLLLVSIANVGGKTVHAAGFTFVCSELDGQIVMSHYGGETALPQKVEVGDSITLWVEPERLQSTLKGNGVRGKSTKIQARINDKTGNTHISEELDISMV